MPSSDTFSLRKLANERSSAREHRGPRKERPAQGSHHRGPATDENSLIRAAVQGDLEAFNCLVLAYQHRIYNQAYYLLGDHMAAEDAVQEAFISAYRALPAYRGGSLRSWLTRIVTNKCMDELRHRKSQPTTPFQPYDGYGEEIDSPYWAADPGETPEERLLSAELVHLIERYLERLGPEQRTILVLVDVLGMAYEEAAEATGWRPGTVKSRLARARVQMRNFLRGYLEGYTPVAQHG
jgi:RNA polymerase sigma-70 factor (ECF subfamily)